MAYDVAFIGAGPGGYVGAIRGAQIGGKICVIEEKDLGGTCLNRGCIPSKAFYASAKRMDYVREGASFGVNAQGLSFDLAACVKRKDEVVGDLVGGIAGLLKGNGVDHLKGRARIKAPGLIEVTQPDGTVTEVSATNIIISTGSRPVDIPSIPLDGKTIVNSDQIWELTDLPESLVIIGGGVIGCEMAYIFSALGSKVTVVEMLDRILATEDKEAARQVSKKLSKKGVEFLVSTKVEKASSKDGVATVTLAGGQTLVASRVIVAVGRRPNTEDLGLDKIGVKPGPKGFIPVNDQMETSAKGVFAVGDVVGRFMLAHVASSESVVAVHNALDKRYWMDYETVPRATFTSPEVASVGKSESELKEEKVPVKIGRFSFEALGKALTMGEPEGFIKLLSHAETGRILGATIVGANASEVIAEVTLAMHMEASPGDVVTTIHAHPTISEAVLEASADTMGLAVHKLGRSPVRKR